MAEEQREPALPAGLGVLFGDGGARRSLSVTLPAGRLVRPNLDRLRPDPKPTTVAQPAFWLSEQPATATLWRRLHAEHARSGLWLCCCKASLTTRSGHGWPARSTPNPSARSTATTQPRSWPPCGPAGSSWRSAQQKRKATRATSTSLHRLAAPGRASPRPARRWKTLPWSPTGARGCSPMARAAGPGRRRPQRRRARRHRLARSMQLCPADGAAGRGRAQLGGPLRGPGGRDRL
jgi:hypothetical protein